jgi:hypothetical protein
MWVSKNRNIRVFAGRNGNILYYKEGKYFKHPSPPDIHFYSVDGYTNGSVILGGGTEDFGELYTMSSDAQFTLLHSEARDFIYNVRSFGNDIIFTTSRRLRRLRDEEVVTLFESDRNIHHLAANAQNDVFMVTNSNTVWHYNGIDTRNIGPDYSGYCMAYRLDVKGDIIYFVARGDNQTALVFRGERRK